MNLLFGRNFGESLKETASALQSTAAAGVTFLNAATSLALSAGYFVVAANRAMDLFRAT